MKVLREEHPDKFFIIFFISVEEKDGQLKNISELSTKNSRLD